MRLVLMEEKGSRGERYKTMECEILKKVGDVITIVEEAKLVDQVICALHSLGVLFFQLDPSLFLGCLDQRYRDQVLEEKSPPNTEKDAWRHVFYCGAAFPTLARILLYDVGSNWLTCFPLSARTHIYDSFFINGPQSEIVQAIIPYLRLDRSSKNIDSSVCSNAERLLVLCVYEKKGLQSIAKEFGNTSQGGKYIDGLCSLNAMTPLSRVAQIIASIPDKVRLGGLAALSTHIFFQQITIQLLVEAQERAVHVHNNDLFEEAATDGTFLFVGEMFARICRRGAAGVILTELVPQILDHVKCCLALSPTSQLDCIISNPKSLFWLTLMEVIRDQHAVERLSEELLCRLVKECVNDTEAYWILWILFCHTMHEQRMRAMFLDKFLFWKIFPVSCLRWILQFYVLECPPTHFTMSRADWNMSALQGVASSLVGVWSRRDFVQSAPMEQQVYITAAVGLCLEKLPREKLETTDIPHSVLRGVSYRLESPNDLVRRMASTAALVFSKVVDPRRPLYLDDDLKDDAIDWEFGLHKRVSPVTPVDESKVCTLSETKVIGAINHTGGKDLKVKAGKKISECRLIDPNEIIDPATLNEELSSDEDHDESLSDTSSNPSLQPYDLSDNDSDLKREHSQLNDIIAALRKPDDPDGVECALDRSENLIRASPDELQHVSCDLAKALLYVRCSDVTVDGNEESAEEKRHKALVALVAMCPFECLDALVKLLYSPCVDTSQRILILDVMTDAAEELANVKILKGRKRQQILISLASGRQWFLPSMEGSAEVGPWKEVSESGTILNYTYRYERELPFKSSKKKSGKTRKWNLNSIRNQGIQEWSENKFPLYGAAFMLPAMQGFDKKRQGIDMLGQDFIVLGKLIHMLGTCMKCMALHPEASALAPLLLDMLSSRNISGHAEAYVRKSVLFAASCTLLALHPTYVATVLSEGNNDVSRALDWIRTWALHIADADPDSECSMMAVSCLQLHAEMALQASRILESADHTYGGASSVKLKGPILLPYSGTSIKLE